MKAAALLLTLLLGSCSGPLYVLLFNNSASPIRISQMEAVVTIAAGTQETLAIAPGSRLRVTTEKERLEFPFIEVSGEYLEAYKWVWYRVHLQFQPDNSIAVVKPKQPMPSTELSAQPEGFPLVPKKTAL